MHHTYIVHLICFNILQLVLVSQGLYENQEKDFPLLFGLNFYFSLEFNKRISKRETNTRITKNRLPLCVLFAWYHYLKRVVSKTSSKYDYVKANFGKVHSDISVRRKVRYSSYSKSLCWVHFTLCSDFDNGDHLDHLPSPPKPKT